MPAGNVSFNALASTTLANYRNTLEDNLTTQVGLWWWLKEKGRVRKESGGSSIVIPLLYGSNSTAGSYAGYDTLALTAQEGVTSAQYNWKQHNVTIAISGIEKAMNNGKEKVIDLLKAKVQQAEMTASENFEDMFLGNGTGNASKDFDGLGNLIGATGTVGGIDSTDALNSWWRSYENNTAGVLTVAQMVTAYNSAARGPTHPDFTVTTQALYEKYESLVAPALRYSDSKTADAGFQNLMFKGSVFTYSDSIAAGIVYFLNSAFLKLVCHTDVWLKPTPADSPVDKDAYYSHILSYGNLTISNRLRGGAKLTAKTA